MQIKKTVLFSICFFTVFFAFAKISVVDDYGKTVSLNSPAKRVISLSPSITETLFSIGAGKNIVGTVDQSNYPKFAKKIKRIGQYPDPDLECIVQLNPDLIVMPSHGNSYQLYEELKKLDLEVYILNPKKIEDISTEMTRLGKLTGTEKVAEQKAVDFLGKLNKIKKNKKPVSVFYELWDFPLMTTGGSTMIDEVIRMCGGENIFGEEKLGYFRVNKENVIRKNPEVIIVSEERMKAGWKKRGEIAAVKNKKVFYLNSDEVQRDSPQILTSISKVCGFL